jgi:hypothetical protein
MPMSDAYLDDGATIPSRPRDEFERSSRPRENGRGRLGTIEREGMVAELSTTLVGQLRAELEERDRMDRERRIREDAARDVQRQLVEQEAEKKRKQREEWDQKVAEAEEARKVAEEKRRDRRQNAMMGLIGALTAAIAGFGTYFTTRPAPPPIQEAEKVKEEAEAAKEQAVKNAVEATAVDQAQDRKLEQLGLQAVDQVVLDVDTTDYTARMLKAVSTRAAREEEPPSFTEAKAKAETIKKHKAEAKKRGKRYDPFDDLPEL